jgi:hypothetical protein
MQSSRHGAPPTVEALAEKGGQASSSAQRWAPLVDGAGQDGRERPGLALALAGEQRGDLVALIERVEQRVFAGPAGAGGKDVRNGRGTRRSGSISPRNCATSSSSGLASGSSPNNPTIGAHPVAGQGQV